MIRFLICRLSLAFALLVGTACAHVQLLIPTPGSDEKQVTLDVRFVQHAVTNGPDIDMPMPESLTVLVNGKCVDLKKNLVQRPGDGARSYSTDYTFAEAGAHVFCLEPQPYWEPEEQVMVLHYTKVALNTALTDLPTESALGWEHWEGADASAGFPVEIKPLLQHTSIWENGLFSGVVLMDGTPAPNTRIEVEYYDPDRSVRLPSKAFTTHILTTDALGAFSFALTKAGWWAFTALPDNGREMKAPTGDTVPVELGGVLWVEATSYPKD